MTRATVKKPAPLAGAFVIDEAGNVLRREPNPNDPDDREQDLFVSVDTLDGTKAGPVRITHADGSTELRAPYTSAELRRIIQQGYERPRPMSEAEALRAFANQVRADEDLASMEAWAQIGFAAGGQDARYAQSDFTGSEDSL